LWFVQYAAKEFQQALDILDMEEPTSKKLLYRSVKEENRIQESDWEMTPASVSLSFDIIGSHVFLWPCNTTFVVFQWDFPVSSHLWCCDYRLTS
jgi:anaphase-promoting complex subunit 6